MSRFFKWLPLSLFWRTCYILHFLLCDVFLSDLLGECYSWWALYFCLRNDNSNIFQFGWWNNFPNWRSSQYSTKCIYNEYGWPHSRRIRKGTFHGHFDSLLVQRSLTSFLVTHNHPYSLKKLFGYVIVGSFIQITAWFTKDHQFLERRLMSFDRPDLNLIS